MLNTVITVLIIIFLATFIRSSFGFGDALISMPLLVITLGLKTATPIAAMVSTTIAILIIATDWKNINLKSVWRLVIASAAGIPIGLLFLREGYESIMKLILALLIISFSAYRILEPKFFSLKSKYFAYLFGFFAGIFGGAYNTNGPFVVVYGNLREWPPEVFRATLQVYFFATNIIIISMHNLAGLWTKKIVILFLYCIPIIFITTLLGSILNHKIPKGKFDKAIYLFLMVIGFSLIVQVFI